MMYQTKDSLFSLYRGECDYATRFFKLEPMILYYIILYYIILYYLLY